jgi:hypothetical protein
LCAHQIIPHDHHFAASYADQDKNCPASGHKSDHSPAFPVHCHAFNDLVSEKSRSFNISQNIHSNFIAIVITIDADNYHSYIQSDRIFALLESITDSETLELSSLRAPPSLA